MKLEDYLDFVAPDDIRIKGHRIGLDQLIDCYQQGYSPEQIALEFPGLNLEKIHAAIAYYLHHQADVDASIQRLRHWQEAAYQEWRKQPSPVVQRLQATIRQHQTKLKTA